MLDRLVAVGVVAHVHNLHLPDFVNRTAIVAVIEMRRDVEYGIHHLAERLFPAHQVNEAGRVVEYRPGIVQAVALREVAAPLERAERLRE